MNRTRRVSMRKRAALLGIIVLAAGAVWAATAEGGATVLRATPQVCLPAHPTYMCSSKMRRAHSCP